MISFDVSSLFFMVPLDNTVDLTLKRIYGDKEIITKIRRNDMKNLLILCIYKERSFFFLPTKDE